VQTVDKDCRQKCNVGTHEHPLAYGEQRENVRLTLSLMSVVKVPVYDTYKDTYKYALYVSDVCSKVPVYETYKDTHKYALYVSDVCSKSTYV